MKEIEFSTLASKLRFWSIFPDTQGWVPEVEGVLLGVLGGGVLPPGSQNSDPISDQKMPLSTPVFRPGL